METGFLNKHDSEYFSTDGYEQSNGFESENSLFNVFTIDYVDRTPENDWIIPEEISTSEKPQKQIKEDFRKTFEDWQQHISSLQSQSVDEAFKDPLLCSPLSDDLPDIFGAPVSIPSKKIKNELPYIQEENLIEDKKPDITVKNEKNKNQLCNLNSELNKEMEIKTLLEIDKSCINESDGILLNNICIKEEAPEIINKSPKCNNMIDKVDVEHIKEEISSPLQDMPVLSPVEEDVQPKLDKYLTMHPPTLEISGNGNLIADDTKMFTTDLGPDNYDVVEIKVEPDEEEAVDLKSVSDSKPVIEAANLDTLLEQFEASASVTSYNICNNNNKHVPKYEKQVTRLSSVMYNKKPSTSTVPKVSSQTEKTIKDSLPREVINRIKDSSAKKKGISVVPAARLPAKGFDHMKDPGATKNKFTKLTTAKRGETVKLDHNYCNGIRVGGNGEEANTTVSSSSLTGGNTPSFSDHSSKKDSGLESGDVSDCSSEPSSTTLQTVPSSSKSSMRQSSSSHKGSSRTAIHVKTEENIVNNHIKVDSCNKDVNEATVIKNESPSSVSNETIVNNSQEEIVEEPKKKKKLNLEEYRSRRKNIKSKPVSPTKSFVKAEMNGFRKLPENAQSAANNPTTPMVNAEVQTQISDEKKEEKKRETSKDRRSSRPLQRYRRRSSSSSSSSSGSRSRSRWHRERSRRRRYSKGRGPRSRSRSRSSSSGRSLSSSSSLSRSRNRNSKYHYRSRTGYRRSNYTRHSRYSQERVSRRHDDWSPVEKMRQIEERRVIYVGQIEEGTTKSQLRERFETFGPIIDISLHFRERGDNYGFVTFAYKMDAYKAVEHGNDYPMEPQYDICFGGRRAFCKQRYSDLDGTAQGYSPYHQNPRSNDSFDLLLREAQEKIRKQKHV